MTADWKRWPVYTGECQADMTDLLAKGGRLTAYQANPSAGVGPREGSWAWRAERLAEEIHHVPHVIMCQSGTQALTTLLVALGSPARVATTAFTFSATVAAIMRAGCAPYFIDVEIPECNLPRFYNESDDFMVGVDLFGGQTRSFDVSDSCQGVGLIPLSDHGVWSFNGRKNVPAGEGGAIYTRDAAVALKCRYLLNHAENFTPSGPWPFATIGENGHMNEPTALLVYHGLREVVQRNERRVHLAHRLNEVLTSGPDLGFIVPTLTRHALYMYPLIVERGCHEIGARLRTAGAECQPGYLTPTLEEYPAFRHLPHGDLTNTHALSRERLILFPQCTPNATMEEMEELGAAIVRAMT